MFTKKQAIVFITKDKIKITLVVLGKVPKITPLAEFVWNKDSLLASFQQVKSQIPGKKIRLLLGDDLSYTTNLNIPANIQPKDERQTVTEKVKEVIPELLNNQDWDYKQTGKTNQTDKEIIVFAPVKDKFLLINTAIQQAGLQLEAVEPQIIAKIRNDDPIIGLALKKDLKGEDKTVLNIVPEKIKQPETPKSPESPPAKKPLIKKSYIIIFFIILAISALIIGGINISNNALNKKPVPSPKVLSKTVATKSISSPSPQASASASPQPVFKPADYKIQVLNGFGGKGVASAVKDILLTKGFTDIDTDNADSFDYTATEISLKSNSPAKLFQTIDQALNSLYEVTRSAQLLTSKSEYAVVIIVGEKNE